MSHVYEFGLRIEERFIEKPSNKTKNHSIRSVLPPLSLLQQYPYKWIQIIYEEKYPHQLLCSWIC
jgi:hypothetical protein